MATAPTVMAFMAPLSTLTSREGQARCQPSSEWRRATSTIRIASTPAAMAAASGNRDASGPISGTGAGPATGFGALATVDFACAAVSFAADASCRHRWCPPATLGRQAPFGWGLRRRCLLAAFLAGAAFLAALAGAFFAAFLARLGRRRFLAGGASAAGGAALRARPAVLAAGCGVRLLVGSILLVCHLAAPLQLLVLRVLCVSVYTRQWSHHARSDIANP